MQLLPRRVEVVPPTRRAARKISGTTRKLPFAQTLERLVLYAMRLKRLLCCFFSDDVSALSDARKVEGAVGARIR